MRSLILTCFLVAACGAEPNPNNSGTTTGTTGGEPVGCEYKAEYPDLKCNPLCADEDSRCDGGAACTLTSAGFQCAKADAAQKLGDTCNEFNTCVEGGCVEIPDTLGSHCAPFCKVDADCSSEQSCTLQIAVEGVATVNVCIDRPSACSVFAQDCAEGEACYLVNAGEGCLAAGTVAVGEDCANVGDCAKGALCISEKCHTMCNPKTGGADPKCKFVCALGESAIEGVDHIGLCQLEDTEPACNLLSQNCDAGQACYYTGSGPRCRPEGTLPLGSSCNGPGECSKGAVCWPKTCRAICNPTDALHPECENQTDACSNLAGAGYCESAGG